MTASLNPKITKDAAGVYWLNWTPDPTAEGYAFVTPNGTSRTLNGSQARTKLGKGLAEPVKATVAPIDLGTRPAEEASYPPVAPPPQPPSGIVVTVNELQGAVNQSKGGEVFLVKPGTFPGSMLTLPWWANVQVRGLDPSEPSSFVGPNYQSYAIYSEGPSTIGPDLFVSNPVGYGIGVRANGRDIDGGRVTGVEVTRNGVSGLYQGTQPGRTHRNFVVDNVVGRENGQRLDLDPHTVKGDGEHTIYVGGGEGVTVGALVSKCVSYDQLHGTPFQGGGGLRDSRFEHLKAYRVKATQGHPVSSFAAVGIFSSYMGTSGIVIDDVYGEDIAGYLAKAIGGATGVLKNSTGVRCGLGLSFGLADGGGNRVVA